MIGNIAGLQAEIRLTENEIALAEERYAANLKLRDRLAVRAHFDGRVLKLPRVDGAAVRQGDVIAMVAKSRDRNVTAFLTQDEVARVGVGDAALLFIPALGETLKGRIISVDRTSGFIDEQRQQRSNAGYNWRGLGERSAQVTIAFLDPANAADTRRYSSGLPVIVNFERRTQSPLFADLAGWLSR